MQTYFDQLERVRFAGPKTDNPLAFRHYNPDEIVLGKRMADHLRFAACYWHNFCWNGADMFGAGSFERPRRPRAMRWKWPNAKRTWRLNFLQAQRAVLLLPRCRRLARRRVAERVFA